MKKRYNDAYDFIKPSEDFAARTMARINAPARRRIPAGKAVAILAAALLSAALFTGTVLAAGHFGRTGLSDMPKYSETVNELAAQVEQIAASGEMQIVLRDVVFENGKLTAIFNCSSEDALTGLEGSLAVDGDSSICSSWVQTAGVNDGVNYLMCEYEIGELTGIHGFEIKCEAAELMTSGGELRRIEGPFEFAFELDTDAVDAMARVYEIGKRIELENGDAVVLERMVCTPIGQRIEYSIETKPGNNYAHYRVSAAGEGMRFVHSGGSLGRGESVNIEPDGFDWAAQKFELSVVITDRYDDLLASCGGVTAVLMQ